MSYTLKKNDQLYLIIIIVSYLIFKKIFENWELLKDYFLV